MLSQLVKDIAHLSSKELWKSQTLKTASKFKIYFAIALSVCLFPTTAQAQMAQNLLIGNAKALAMGNAVTADPPGIDSIHFNPAGLTRMKGRRSHMKFIVASVDIFNDLISTPDYEQSQLDFNPNVRDPLANTRSEVDKFAVYLPGEGITPVPLTAAPLGGFSYSLPDSPWTFATAFYAPLILGFTREDQDPGIYFGKEVAMSRLTMFSPTAAYQFNEHLSLGFGLGFSYVGAGLDIPFRSPSGLVKTLGQLTDQVCDRRDDLGNQFVLEIEVINLCEGSVSPYDEIVTLRVDVEKKLSMTYNLGLLWEPNAWLSLGMVYQSPVTDTLKGDVEVEIGEGVYDLVEGAMAADPIVRGLALALGWQEGNPSIKAKGHFDLPLPAHLAFGVSAQVTPRLKVNLDVKWTETSAWDSFYFKVDEEIQLLQFLQLIDGIEVDGINIPRGYNDTLNWGIGFEYQYKDDLALRFGYEPRKTGVPNDKRDPLIPIGDFDLIGFGFSKKIKKDTEFDVSFGYAKSEEYIPAGSSSNGNDDSRFDNIIYNPVAGLDVRSVTEIFIVELSYLSTF